MESTTDRNIYKESEEFEISDPKSKYKKVGSFDISSYDDPYSIVVSNDSIYLTETGTWGRGQRLVKLTKNGVYVTQRDLSPAKPFQIALDRNGYLYVAENENRRVAQYDSNLKPTGLVWKGPAGDIPTIKPRGVAVDNQGNVYILDYSPPNYRLLKYDKTGKFLKRMSNSLYSALNVAVDNTKNRVYVADRLNNEVVFFSTSGKFQDYWGDKVFEDEAHPSGIDVDSKGNVFVCTQNDDKQKIYMIGPAGKLLDQFGGPGIHPNQFKHPVSISIDKSDNDTIYVLDNHSKTHRITKWVARKDTN